MKYMNGNLEFSKIKSMARNLWFYTRGDKTILNKIENWK